MTPKSDDRAVDAWLDGLTGRPGDGYDHRAGESLRAALKAAPLPAQESLSWAQVEYEARKRLGTTSSPAAASPTLIASVQTAANDSSVRRWWPAAAAVLLATGLWALVDRGVEEGELRGDGRPQASWVVTEPMQRAEALAADLRGLGAEVAIRSSAADVVPVQVTLTLVVPPASRAAVSRRLAELDTALDQNGRLTLEVRAP